MKMFKNENFMKIDFYDMEPDENDEGNVVEQRGEVTRITVPVAVFDDFCKKYVKNQGSQDK